MTDMIGGPTEGKLLMTAAPIYAQMDPWTIDDLDRLPDGVRAEIVDGSLVLSPAPTSWHQLATSALSRWLADAAPPELVALEAPGVDIRESYLQPDVAVVRADVAEANVKSFRPEHVRLAVEVVSRSHAGFDRIEKPRRYAEAGIPYFWRVELTGDRAPYVVLHGLDDTHRQYTELGTVRAGDEQTVDIGFPVALRPADLTRRRSN